MKTACRFFIGNCPAEEVKAGRIRADQATELKCQRPGCGLTWADHFGRKKG